MHAPSRPAHQLHAHTPEAQKAAAAAARAAAVAGSSMAAGASVAAQRVVSRAQLRTECLLVLLQVWWWDGTVGWGVSDVCMWCVRNVMGVRWLCVLCV